LKKNEKIEKKSRTQFSKYFSPRTKQQLDYD